MLIATFDWDTAFEPPPGGSYGYRESPRADHPAAGMNEHDGMYLVQLPNIHGNFSSPLGSDQPCKMTPWEVATQSTWCRSLDSKGKYTKMHSVVAQYRALRACFNFLSWKTCPYVTVDTKIFHRSLICFSFHHVCHILVEKLKTPLRGLDTKKNESNGRPVCKQQNSLCNFFQLLNDIQREWTNPAQCAK